MGNEEIGRKRNRKGAEVKVWELERQDKEEAKEKTGWEEKAEM